MTRIDEIQKAVLRIAWESAVDTATAIADTLDHMAASRSGPEHTTISACADVARAFADKSSEQVPA